MTPAARVQSSIKILDEILSGAPVEKALTGWARRSRFAGSKDRAAVRDHVFAALRCKRSFAALGGSQTGRGLMIGAMRADGIDVTPLFTGDRHAPDPVDASDTGRDFISQAEQFDIPDWLWPRFVASLGNEAIVAAKALQTRAPVHLRVNLHKTDVPGAVRVLAEDDIQVERHPACKTALNVIEGARKVAQSRAYLDGLVELQDAASQSVVAALPLRPGIRVLDYCAGGGGKALALAAHPGVEVFAHDVNPKRMRDIPNRAARAGVDIALLNSEQIVDQAPFDIVLADAPCSGSGSWRRAPAGKWALTETRLAELIALQFSILRDVAALVRSGGCLAYATCSMLADENGKVVEQFVADHPDWSVILQQNWLVTDGVDGFFTAHLTQ